MSIILKNISKQFDTTVVLDQLHLEIPEGKITCIMGPSGSGKTTLLSILMGLIKADSGVVHGIENKRIAAVFQEDRLCEEITVLQNIKMVCNRKINNEQIKKELLNVGLAGVENKRILELSGGMKRRVAIVRAIMADSDLIIMDEPFKGLDETLKLSVIEYVKEKTSGKTVIVVTHDKDEAVALLADIITI